MLRELYLHKIRRAMFIIFLKNFSIFFTQTSSLIVVTFSIFIDMGGFICEMTDIMTVITEIRSVYGFIRYIVQKHIQIEIFFKSIPVCKLYNGAREIY